MSGTGRWRAAGGPRPCAGRACRRPSRRQARDARRPRQHVAAGPRPVGARNPAHVADLLFLAVRSDVDTILRWLNRILWVAELGVVRISTWFAVSDLVSST